MHIHTKHIDYKSCSRRYAYFSDSLSLTNTHTHTHTHTNTRAHKHTYTPTQIYQHTTYKHTLPTHTRICALIAVLLPAAGIEPTSRYQRTILRRQPYTTRLSKYLSNSISASTAEWYKAVVVRLSSGTVTWVRFQPPVKGLQS